jgi:Flp pilus assembly protein TadG
MVALLAVALIGMVGLALDVGRLMVAKAELRRAVDAAALAGALKLSDHPEIEASEYMAEHEPEADVESPQRRERQPR